MTSTKAPLSPKEIFADYLCRNKKRRTAERYAILDRAMRAVGHFSVEALCDTLRDEDYHVSTTTVYSTLELLVDCGLVIRHRFNDRRSLYEKAPVSQGAQCHHHLICTVCGKIKEMRDPELTQLIEAKRFPAFTPAYFALNIYGTCSACTRRKRRKKLSQK